MYRQNNILNDFVNFLKARGRFRSIEFIENSVQATPRIPDLPSLIFYIEETQSDQQYILEIHGNESTVMNREIQEFFQLNQLGLQKVKNKNYLLTKNNESLTIEIEGLGSAYETLTNQILDLVENENYTITNTQKTLIFSYGEYKTSEQKEPPSVVKKPQIRTQTRPTDVKVMSTKEAEKASGMRRSIFHREKNPFQIK